MRVIKPWFPIAALCVALLGVGACSEESAKCLDVSKERAIELARESKKGLRFNEEEQRKWASGEVRNVELRNISHGSQIGALVTFVEDGPETPIGLVYGDCDVEWSVTEAKP